MSINSAKNNNNYQKLTENRNGKSRTHKIFIVVEWRMTTILRTKISMTYSMAILPPQWWFEPPWRVTESPRNVLPNRLKIWFSSSKGFISFLISGLQYNHFRFIPLFSRGERILSILSESTFRAINDRFNALLLSIRVGPVVEPFLVQNSASRTLIRCWSQYQPAFSPLIVWLEIIDVPYSRPITDSISFTELTG